MITDRHEAVEVSSDGHSVWVNKHGTAWARYSGIGVEFWCMEEPHYLIHGDDPIKGRQNWETFVARMATKGVNIDPKHRPTWLPVV